VYQRREGCRAKICRYAEREGYLNRIEVLGFVDHKPVGRLDKRLWRQVINLLAKGSLKHCTQQLHKTPQQHIDDIFDVLDYADRQGMTVNLYLEDWSSGMKDSARQCLPDDGALQDTNIKRFLLPDHTGHHEPTARHGLHEKDARLLS
jgi:D-citramalate synthase